MESDARIVKAILAAGVLKVLTSPGASELKRKEARGQTLRQVSDVTEELFAALFMEKK